MTYGVVADQVSASMLIYQDLTAWDDWVLSESAVDESLLVPYLTKTDGYALMSTLTLYDAWLDTSAAAKKVGACLSTDSMAASCWTVSQSGSVTGADLALTQDSSYYQDLSAATISDADDPTTFTTATDTILGFENSWSCTMPADLTVEPYTIACHRFQVKDVDSAAATYRFDADSPTDGTCNLWLYNEVTGVVSTAMTADTWLSAVSGFTFATTAAALIALNAI